MSGRGARVRGFGADRVRLIISHVAVTTMPHSTVIALAQHCDRHKQKGSLGHRQKLALR